MERDDRRSSVHALQRLVTLDGEYPELMQTARDHLPCLRGPQPAVAVVVSLADIDRALRSYDEGDLSADQLHEWAELLEMSDHVAYDRDAEQAIADLLFRLATPEINEPITPSVVRRMRASLIHPRPRDPAP